MTLLEVLLGLRTPLTVVDRSFFTNRKLISCCDDTDATDGIGTTNVGYWSPLYFEDYNYPKYSKDWPANFTVKWLQGHALGSVAELANRTEAISVKIDGLVWAEPPEMTALNYRPVIETAPSRVTVGALSSRIHNHEILEEPSPDEWGWLDVAVHREDTPGSRDPIDGKVQTNIPTNTTMRLVSTTSGLQQTHTDRTILTLSTATTYSSFWRCLAPPTYPIIYRRA